MCERICYMSLRLSGAVLVLCMGVSAQSSVTVQQIKDFIHSAIKQKQADKEVAATLRGLKLSERLNERTVEDLQGEGAGPKTVAALKEMAAGSAALAAPKPVAPKPVYVPPPPPSSEAQGKIIDEVRDYALNYTKSLPDYICAQVTRRFYSPAGRESWRASDVILARLTYFEQKEDYKLVTVNNTVATDKAYTSVGGAISQGEFGSMLREIFEPQSNTSFDWERWATLRGRLSYVFSYRVPLEYSQYTIHHQTSATDKGQTIVVGYHGSVFIDKATSTVVRISLEADNIPAGFPVHQAGEVLDYDFVKIGDREALLPLTADFRSHVDNIATKNNVEFRNYRKFSADASIKFDETDVPPPLNEQKTKEQAPR